jgi:hypothetical protein
LRRGGGGGHDEDGFGSCRGYFTGGAEGGDLVGLLPREAGFAEVAVVGRLAVNRAEQIELLDDVGGLEAEDLRHGLRAIFSSETLPVPMVST